MNMHERKKQTKFQENANQEKSVGKGCQEGKYNNDKVQDNTQQWQNTKEEDNNNI